MKPRQATDESAFLERDPLWERTREFERLVQKMLVDPDDTVLPEHLSEGRRIALEAEVAARRWGRFSRGEYREAMTRAMRETRRWLVAPISDDPIPDLAAAWRQPEAKALWQRIISSVDGWASVIPGLHFTLGVMLYVAAGRATAQIRPGRGIVIDSSAMRSLIAELAEGCDGKYRCVPAPVSYTQVLRLMPRLCEHVAAEVHVTLAEIATVYRDWGLPVGRYLAVDGSLVPAWVPQRSAYVNGTWSQAREDSLRRRSPEAGYVVRGRDYLPDGLGVRELAREPITSTRKRSRPKRVRGYSNTSLIDLATGLVLAFDLRDATQAHEPRILREVLLPTTLDLSPDIEIRAIVGDGQFDDDPTHEHLERCFGIHLVAGRKSYAFEHRGDTFSETECRSVSEVGGNGVAKCRAHGCEVEYKSLEPNRKKLPMPLGRPAEAELFRSRFICPVDRKKLSVPTWASWSNLPFYPHNPFGRLDLFCIRAALLHRRRNQIESVFSALQTGYKLQTDGSDRVRIAGRPEYEALIALANANRALLTLLNGRVLRGDIPTSG